jgi:hypothetical protein
MLVPANMNDGCAALSVVLCKIRLQRFIEM